MSDAKETGKNIIQLPTKEEIQRIEILKSEHVRINAIVVFLSQIVQEMIGCGRVFQQRDDLPVAIARLKQELMYLQEMINGPAIVKPPHGLIQ